MAEALAAAAGARDLGSTDDAAPAAAIAGAGDSDDVGADAGGNCDASVADSALPSSSVGMAPREPSSESARRTCAASAASSLAVESTTASSARPPACVAAVPFDGSNCAAVALSSLPTCCRRPTKRALRDSDNNAAAARLHALVTLPPAVPLPVVVPEPPHAFVTLLALVTLTVGDCRPVARPGYDVRSLVTISWPGAGATVMATSGSANKEPQYGARPSDLTKLRTLCHAHTHAVANVSKLKRQRYTRSAGHLRPEVASCE